MTKAEHIRRAKALKAAAAKARSRRRQEAAKKGLLAEFAERQAKKEAEARRKTKAYRQRHAARIKEHRKQRAIFYRRRKQLRHWKETGQDVAAILGFTKREEYRQWLGY